MRRAFPRGVCRKLALVETLFSSVKCKWSACAPGRTLEMHMQQTLLLGVAYNIYQV
jgi:hypothetical protein